MSLYVCGDPIQCNHADCISIGPHSNFDYDYESFYSISGGTELYFAAEQRGIQLWLRPVQTVLLSH